MIDFILTYNLDATRPGFCRVRIFGLGRTEHHGAIVLYSEMPHNPGASVTNAAEDIASKVCQELDLDPCHILWIEHYPIEIFGGKEEFALVSFRWDRHRPFDPSWNYRITREWLKTLVGQSLEE